MKVSELITALQGMPQDASACLTYDGAVRSTLDVVWVTRGGIVACGAYGDVIYSTDDRPEHAPAEEENWYWTLPEAPRSPHVPTPGLDVPTPGNGAQAPSESGYDFGEDVMYGLGGEVQALIKEMEYEWRKHIKPNVGGKELVLLMTTDDFLSAWQQEKASTKAP